MENHNKISSTELLFLTHPNSCSGLDLIKITVLELVFDGQLSLEYDKRLIKRKRAGDIEKVFFSIKRLNPKELNSFQRDIFNNATENEMILQQFIRKLDKSLNGVEVFKYEVFKVLLEKKWVKSSFTFFGLFKPKYRLTELGELTKKNFIKNSNNKGLAQELISVDPSLIMNDLKDIDDFLPKEYSLLKFMTDKDWEGASNRSGLDPRGFLPR